MSQKYSQAFKIQAVEKVLLRADNVTIKEVANSLGVDMSSLNRWRLEAKQQTLNITSTNEISLLTQEKRPQDWTLEERFNMVLGGNALDGEALSEYCREQGIYPHHIIQWKLDFVSGNTEHNKPVSRTEIKNLKHENKVLKKELNRKDKTLAETAALLVLQKKSPRDLGKRRGQLTMNVKRDEIIGLITEACHTGAKQENACKIIGISAKTFQRWNVNSNKQDGRIAPKHSPKHKLSALERQRIIKIANQPEYANLLPCQIVPRLADTGIYITSEASFYRVLNERNQLKHRDKSKPDRKTNKPRALTAKAPNQIYTWDITYLPTQVKGVFLYLYLMIDIYSRKIVGWQVHHEELSILAADLMTDICNREKIEKNQVTLHSDNGSPMKGATMLATLQELGVVPSFSRPSVSNDNPYSESVFRTLKYRPEYPEKPFENIGAARDWVNVFVKCYNHEHRHSGIKFTTPHERHTGQDIKILAARTLVYKKARLENPNRWSGEIKNWDHIKEVYLNPEKGKSEIVENKAA